MKSIKNITFLSLGALLLAGTVQAATTYTVVDLGNGSSLIPGNTAVVPARLNENGSIVGYVSSYTLGQPTKNVAFLYDGTMRKIDPWGTASMAGDINSSGQMVGNEAQTSASNQAWFYDGSAMHSLGTLSGSGSSGAAGINNNGLVVGSSSYTGSGLWNYHAFLYDGSMHDLGTLGGASSLGSDINDSGVIVGSSTTAGGQQHAYFYDGTMRDLGVLAGGFSSAASAINASGAIVGVSTINAAGAKHAVLWDGNTIQDLGALGAIYGSGGSGGDYASANDINSSGLVVGDSVNDDGYIPFLYDGATMFNLNDLLVGNVTGLQLQRATGINDKGQIIGMASNGHLYLLNPVPIPAAGWLMGSGLAGLVAARRYRRR